MKKGSEKRVVQFGKNNSARLQKRSKALRVAVGVCLASSLAHSASAITIGLDFGPGGNGLTGSQQAIFGQAASIWDNLLTGYQPGIVLTGPLIKAQALAIDGAGGVLGNAGPTFGSIQGGYLLATQGTMTFDTADIGNMQSNGSLLAVILHEMAHVLGFGTLWSYQLGPTIYNPVYAGGGKYTGANALAAYQTEFNQPGATFVPVELGGGAGTANAHWNEVDGGGGLTGIVDGQGHDFRNELMTGWLNNPTFISQTTLNSFVDIGFTIPDTGNTLMLISFSMIGLMYGRKRLAQ